MAVKTLAKLALRRFIAEANDVGHGLSNDRAEIFHIPSTRLGRCLIVKKQEPAQIEVWSCKSPMDVFLKALLIFDRGDAPRPQDHFHRHTYAEGRRGRQRDDHTVPCNCGEPIQMHRTSRQIVWSVLDAIGRRLSFAARTLQHLNDRRTVLPRPGISSMFASFAPPTAND